MEWTRSETLALAAPACNICLGLGLRIGRHGATHPCNCVLRAIFRACFDRFRECVSREKYMSRVTLDPLPGKDRRGSWGRKDEEFAADFCLVSKRSPDGARASHFQVSFSARRGLETVLYPAWGWTAGISSTPSIALNRNWAGFSVN